MVDCVLAGLVGAGVLDGVPVEEPGEGGFDGVPVEDPLADVVDEVPFVEPGAGVCDVVTVVEFAAGVFDGETGGSADVFPAVVLAVVAVGEPEIGDVALCVGVEGVVLADAVNVKETAIKVNKCFKWLDKLHAM